MKPAKLARVVGYFLIATISCGGAFSQTFDPSFPAAQSNLCTGGIFSSWKPIGPDGGSPGFKITLDPSTEERLYANNACRIFRSDDNGIHWYDVSPKSEMYSGIAYLYITVSNGNLYLTTNSATRVLRSTSGGNSWETCFVSPDREIVFIDGNNPQIFFSRRFIWPCIDSLHVSFNSGQTWISMTDSLDFSVGSIRYTFNHSFPNDIFAAQIISYCGDVASGYHYFLSRDYGKHWRMLDLDSSLSFPQAFFNPIDSNVIYSLSYTSIHRSHDGGATWEKIGAGLPFLLGIECNPAVDPGNENIIYLTSGDSIGMFTHILYKSTDGGDNFLPVSTITPVDHISDLVIDPGHTGNIFVASFPYGMYYSNDTGAHWDLRSIGLKMARIGSLAVATAETLYAGVDGIGIKRTTNGGDSWTTVIDNGSSYAGNVKFSHANHNTLYTTFFPVSLFLQDTTLAQYGVIFTSSNAGESWYTIRSPYKQINVFDATPDGNTIFADTYLGDTLGTVLSGIQRSTDGGKIWQILSLPTGPLNGVQKILVDPYDHLTVYAEIILRESVWKNSLIRSTDGGNSWATIVDSAGDPYLNTIDSRFLYCISHSSGRFLVSSNRGITWVDGGLSWDILDMSFDPINSSIVYVSTYDRGLLKSMDYGQTWVAFDSLSSFPDFRYIGVGLSRDGSTVLFGASGMNGILSNTLTGPSQVNEHHRSEMYRLSQNYPNPFNPATHLEFQVAKHGLVKLSVYDLLGREVATIINEQLSPGTYTRAWDASKFTSGIYFYRLQAGNFTDTKKLLLLK